MSTADGGSFRVGDGTAEPLAIRFMTVSTELAVLLDLDLRFAELYVDGDIVVEQGSLAGLLTMLLSQAGPQVPRDGRSLSGYCGISGAG